MLTLIIKLWKERRAATPSRAFRVALREKVTATLPLEIRTEYRDALFRRTAISLAMILPLVFGGTSVYAYSSVSVTEGSVLYPVKRGIESIQLRFRSDQGELAAYRLELYERRLDEAERLLESHEAMIETLNAAVELNELIELSTEFVEDREDIPERLRKNQERYETVRMRVYSNEPSGDSSLRTPSFMIRRMQH